MGICAIWGPPNSGKTTLAIDLAYTLSSQGCSVCLISPERYSELSARLAIHILPGKSLAAFHSEKDSVRQIVHTAAELLYVLAVPTEQDAFGEELSSDAAKALIEQSEAVFDAVLVDCASACDNPLSAWAMQKAHTVLMTSGADAAAALWYSAFSKAAETVREKVLPVCLECRTGFDYTSLHALTGYTPPVWLPYIPYAEELLSRSNTLCSAKGKAGRKYAAAMEKLCTRLEEGGAL